MIKFVQLKYFVACVDAGSLTTAAKNLYISQPALSKQLVQLEHDLGCQLLHRSNSGIELTNAGKFLYERSSAILADVEKLTLDMRVYSERSILKIGALPSIGSHFIPSFLSKITANNKVELIIKDTTAELVEMLDNDRIDFAFVQDATKYKNILVETLFYESYDAILSKQSSLSKIENLTLSDLLKESIILHKQPCDIRAFFERYCMKNKLNYHLLMEIEFNDSLLPFVSNKIGPTILPNMVSSQIQHSEVLVKRLNDKNFGRTIDFLYKPHLKRIAKEIILFSKEFVH